MKITWDEKAKAVYISDLPREDWAIQDHSAKINDYLYLDYNLQGEVIGIEILNASLPVVEGIGNHKQRYMRRR